MLTTHNVAPLTVLWLKPLDVSSLSIWGPLVYAEEGGGFIGMVEGEVF